jgi:hypothetical protein
LANQTKEKAMTKRIQRSFVAVAALVTLAVGGSAIASAQQSGQAAKPAHHASTSSERVGGPDTDNIQSGDQCTPDTTGVAAKATAVQAEAPGTEQSPASEQPGAAEQPGSESAANDDGPGGHADEPGNAAADHQFQGVE